MLRTAWCLFKKETFTLEMQQKVRKTDPELVFARPDLYMRMAKKVQTMDK